MAYENGQWNTVLDAIADGVHARLDSELRFSESVTSETIGIARSLGIPDTAIQQWAGVREQLINRERESRMKQPVTPD